MNLNLCLCQLIEYGKKQGIITDLYSAEKKLKTLFEVDELICQNNLEVNYQETMDALLKIAYQMELYPVDTIDEMDAFEAKIIDCIMPEPEEVKNTFLSKYKKHPEDATNYLYKLSQDVNYIKVLRLKENKSWTYESEYGNIELTINLAKPEKDPRDIAKALKQKSEKQEGIPLCVICKENEQNYHNARMNLRIVPFKLGEELWHFQYSPYQYYNEHAIILHDEHRPMKISLKTMDYLLDFVDQFPTYFIGSNADLPIVGGSILNHDHFQAGKYHFPIENAKTLYQLTLKDIKIEHLNWPLSTVRLTSYNRELIKEYFNAYFDLWLNYENKDLNIIPKTNETRHQTITPIVRKINDCYEVDLILRNNRVNDQYPDGIFHPHQDVQHIKKENIGLIEAMGLAILPGRLKKELEDIKNAINHHGKLNDELIKHEPWIIELKHNYHEISLDDLKREVGKKFSRVLEDAGVFKLDEQGKKAIISFIESIKKGC